jgi:hypothetical protein
MKKLLLLSLCLLFAISARSAQVTISGATQVCPNSDNPKTDDITYTYTAYGSDAFGSVRGCFYWSYYENGQWKGITGIPVCNCQNSTSSQSSYTVKWGNTLGPGKVRVVFVPYYSTDVSCSDAVAELNVNIRTFSKIEIRDEDGGLTFCGGDRKLIEARVPGGQNSFESCYYHYTFLWTVPQGWLLEAVNGEIIPNGGVGQRYVYVTAPSNLQSGTSGNYTITAQTNPSDWPWTVQSSRQVYVGTVSFNSFYLRGTRFDYESQGSSTSFTVCPGEELFFRPAINTNVLEYQWSGNGTPVGNEYRVIAPSSSGSSFNISCRVRNSCGWSNWVTADIFTMDCDGGEEPWIVYPNPAESYVIVEYKSEDNTSEKFDVKILNFSNKVMKEASSNKTSLRINLDNVPNGTYIVKIYNRTKASTVKLFVNK